MFVTGCYSQSQTNHLSQPAEKKINKTINNFTYYSDENELHNLQSYEDFSLTSCYSTGGSNGSKRSISNGELMMIAHNRPCSEQCTWHLLTYFQ